MADRKLFIEVVLDDDKAEGNLKRLEKTGTQSSGSIAKGFIGAQVAMAALNKTWDFAVGLAKDTIAAANEQAAAVSTLNAALQSQGNYTAETSQKIQEFASEMQKVTTIGDEATIAVAGQIEAMTGLSGEALPQATQAAIQLSKAYGIDLSAATKLVGKELTSSTSALTRYGIQIDKSGTQTEQLNQILEATKSGMAIARAEAQTFEGRLQQLKNSIGDAKEAAGKLITENQSLQFGMGELTGAVDDAVQRMNDWFEENKALVEQITKNVIVAVSYLAEVVAFLGGEMGKAIILINEATTAFRILDAVQEGNYLQAAQLALQMGKTGAAVEKIDESTGAFMNDMEDLRAQMKNFSFTEGPEATSALGAMEDSSYGAADGTKELKKQMHDARKEAKDYGDMIKDLNEGLGKLGSPANRIGVRQAIRTAIGAGDTAQAALLSGAADLVEEQALKNEREMESGGGGAYTPSGGYSGGAEAYSSTTVTNARRGLPMAGGPSSVISGYQGMFGAMFSSPFHGSLFPNAQGSIADRGASEANPVIVKVVGNSINLAEAVV